MKNNCKYTFINSFAEKKKGTCWVKIRHNRKDYYGIAQTHPDDIKNFSENIGCEYAELRAFMKILKAKRKEAKKEYYYCKNFVKKCCEYKNFDKESNTAKAMYRQLNVKKRIVDNYTKEINEIKEHIFDFDRKREAFLQKYRKK